MSWYYQAAKSIDFIHQVLEQSRWNFPFDAVHILLREALRFPVKAIVLMKVPIRWKIKRIGIKLTGREESDTRKTHLRCTIVPGRENMVRQRMTVRKSTPNGEVHFYCISVRICINACVSDDVPSDLFQELVTTPIDLEHRVWCKPWHWRFRSIAVTQCKWTLKSLWNYGYWRC